MRLFFLIIFIINFSTVSAIAAELTDFASPEGIKRLERSQAKADFFPLTNHFEPQENKIFCGLASSAIVLNTLRLGKADTNNPQDNSVLSEADRKYLPKGFNPIFERYTQHNLLSPKTKSKEEILGKPSVVNGKPVADYGLQLNQLAALLSSHGLSVTAKTANETLTDETIRKDLIANLQTAGDYVLVNYSRKTLNQGDLGHISPLGAYDKDSDSFLILDVNPNTSKWVWVTATNLIAAMRTFDTIENRGYILIKEKKV